MFKMTLCAGALLACSSMSWGAICATGITNLGTLQANADGPSATFGAACTALGNPDPANTSAWSFTNYYRFSLESPATGVFGGIDLNFTRTGEWFPNSPTRGDPLFMITTSAISFIHDGIETFVGTEGPGHHEHANIFSQNLAAGDYLMVVRGRVFDTPTNSGWYNGSLYVDYGTAAAATATALAVSAPVPEPGALAAMLLGLPAVAWMARRTRRRPSAA